MSDSSSQGLLSTLTEDFELGVAGIKDAITGGHSAATTYAAVDPSGGAAGTPEYLAAYNAAATAEDNGALSQAWDNTLNQVGKPFHVIETIVIAVAVIAVSLAAIYAIHELA